MISEASLSKFAAPALTALPRQVLLLLLKYHRLPFTSTAISGQHVSEMTSVDFAAAQQRVEKRRRLRAAEARTRVQSQRDLQASNASTLLPFPLDNLGQRGLEAWNAIKGREGTRPAYRVGQVDAELLDEELLELLKGQVGEGLKYFGVRFITLAATSM